MRPASRLLAPPAVLVLGLIVREALSFWTAHPFDMEVWIRTGYAVSHGAEPYGFFPPVPDRSFAYQNQVLGTVGYPPLWPLLLGLIDRAYGLLPVRNRFLAYFLMKQPGILGDVALGYLLSFAVTRLGGDRATSERAFRFWLLSPFTIIMSSVWGQFDALVTVFLILPLLLRSSTQRGASLGLGIFLKLIPLLFIPYMIVANPPRRRREAASALFWSAGLTALVMLTFGWNLDRLWGTMSSQVPGSVPLGMTYMNLLAGPFSYPVLSQVPRLILALHLLWIPAVLGATWFVRRRLSGTGAQTTVQAFLFVLVSFLLSRWGVNDQLVLYLLALLLLDTLLWHPERRPLLTLTWILGLAYLLVNSAMLLTFLGPVSPAAMNYAFSLNDASDASLLPLIRSAMLYAVGILFSLHLVQIGRAVANPASSPKPWPLRFFDLVTTWPRRRRTGRKTRGARWTRRSPRAERKDG